ncbi:hypothetical protein E2C01_101201 [Portunus trituberculatus]|uniref:Uncharacterized protein n=1 Tax=Portunus trituberculatus TaxID=210409 RepID=A0A5B7KF09_PORTR|nr:hypothetical protein [Portunus trituberculatus]
MKNEFNKQRYSSNKIRNPRDCLECQSFTSDSPKVREGGGADGCLSLLSGLTLPSSRTFQLSTLNVMSLGCAVCAVVYLTTHTPIHQVITL